MKSTDLSRRVRGQTLVWFLATVAACAALLYSVYNVGQITAAKQKLVNATDAAALAGATEQARLLNLMAYGNRAMMATDVLVGQMATLDSWLRFLQTSAQSISVYSHLIPGGGAVIAQALRQLAHVVDVIETDLSVALPGVVAGMDVVKQGISAHNDLAYASGAAISNSLASSVLSANQTVFGGRTDSAPVPFDAGVSRVVLGANQSAWEAFSSVYRGEQRGRTAAVVNASRSDFMQAREGNGLTSFTLLNQIRFEKRGVTRLMAYERWEAQDSWDIRYRRGFFGGWSNTTVPLGWGRADIGDGGDLQIGNTAAQNLAFDNRFDLDEWSGVSSVRDLSEVQRTSQSPELPFLMAASKASVDNRTSGSLGIAPRPLAGVLGSPHLDERLLADRLSSVSAARVYFLRPQRGVGDWTADRWGRYSGLFREDSAKEYASLYNPFWQASLAPVTRVQKAAILVAMGAGHLTTPSVLDALP